MTDLDVVNAVGQWVTEAPKGLVALVSRITKHAKVDWDKMPYDGEPDSRVPVETLREAEVFSSWTGQTDSRFVPDPEAESDDLFDERGTFKETRLHHIVVDVDVPAWLVPSSREDHHHLYVDLGDGCSQEAYFKWLDAGAEIGFLEPGYVSACKAREMTSVRAPWIKKTADQLEQNTDG